MSSNGTSPAYYASVTLGARTFGNPLLLARSVEQTVHSLDADVALYDLTTLDSRIRLATSTQRMGGTFVGEFGIVALALAAIGIYGVLAYTTRQRTHEIGVRMALGAEPRNICALVLAQGARLAGLGIAIGLSASLVLTRALSSELFGVSATDPLTYAGWRFCCAPSHCSPATSDATGDESRSRGRPAIRMISHATMRRERMLVGDGARVSPCAGASRCGRQRV
jgi:ABC-type antimicrobial peptide transport system permease subunit